MKIDCQLYYRFASTFRIITMIGIGLALLFASILGYTWVELTDTSAEVHKVVEKESQEARNVDDNGDPKEMAQREE